MPQEQKKKNSAGNHDSAQHLAHGKRQKDISEVSIRLAEILDKESDCAVADKIEGKHCPGRFFYLSYAPQNCKDKNSFKKSFV